MSEVRDRQQALVLELFTQDLQAGLDGAVKDKQPELVRFVEKLWDKYRVALTALKDARMDMEVKLSGILGGIGYA